MTTLPHPSPDDTPAARHDSYLRPPSDYTRRACKALHEHRLADAASNIKAISTDSLTEQAWKHLLTGRLMVAEKKFSRAKPELLQAAGLAFTDASAKSQPSDLHRLAASALNLVGWIYRRQDQPTFATSVHEAALQLRTAHGTTAEQWDTIVELGLDAELARNFDEALQFYTDAIDIAGKLDAPHDQFLAVNYDHLTRVFLAKHATQQAVDAARAARTHWRAHDIRLASASRADLALGTALLTHAEFHLLSDPPSVHQAIEESVELLEQAKDALAAFGSKYNRDVDQCRQQLEVAKKLQSAASK